jgi:tetratricopeptide (TPR) repeat protein
MLPLHLNSKDSGLGSPKDASPNLLTRTLSRSPLSSSFASLLTKLSPGRARSKRIPSKENLFDKMECVNPLFSLDDIEAEQVVEVEDIDDEPFSLALRGVNLAGLLELDIAGNASVGAAIEHLDGLGAEAFAERMEQYGGPASAVVLCDEEMRWSDFIAALSTGAEHQADATGGSQAGKRYLWIRGLSTPPPSVGEPADAVVAAITACKRVEVLLPSWANIDTLWTPENCRLARMDAGFVVRATPRDEKGFALAANRGLPLNFFDALLAPPATIGPRMTRALKEWACNLLDAAVDKYKLEPAMRNFALGHVHCAAKSFDEAIRQYGAAREADALSTVLAVADMGEALRRSGQLADALSVFQCLITENAANEDDALAVTFHQSLGRVLMDQGEFLPAQRAFQTCLDTSERHFAPKSEKAALAHCALANALGAQLLWLAAREHLEAALELRRELRQQSKVADTLLSLGAVLLQEDNHPRALRVFTEALELSMSVWGPAHPSTLECMSQIALIYLASNDTSEALELLRAVVNKRLGLFGQDDERTLAAIRNLVLVYNRRGEFSKARPLLEKTLQAQQRMFGVDSEQASKTMKEIVGAMVASRSKWD